MKATRGSRLGGWAMVVAAAGVMMVFASRASAHCDTMHGPLVPEAQAALEKGEVTPILKWVRAADEAEIKAAFAKAQAVRSKGAEAKDLADHYFLETLVRVHRAGEGAPYTGLKDEPVEPIVAMADKALADKSPDALSKALSAHLSETIAAKLHTAVEARAHQHDSVAAGRAYVAAYVEYVHYVENVHTALLAAGHAHGDAAPAPAEHAGGEPAAPAPAAGHHQH